LIDHFVRESSGTASVVKVECIPDAATELHPLVAVLDALTEPPLRDAPPLVMRTMAQLVPHRVERAIRDSYAGATLGRAELFAGITDALGHICAKRGTIVVIEDLHWADASTLHFLAHLAPRLDAMRLMVVTTTRAEPFEHSETLADVTSRLLRAHTVRALTLHPMQRDELLELIDGALAGRRALPASTIAGIIARCDGNPFFVEELLQTAVGRRPAEDAALPLSIRASVRHRLANFSAADRALFDIAAVVGVRFEHAFLAELSGRDHDDVLRTLRVARAANVIDDVDGDWCRFHHALTRDAIYASLLSAETQALHRRILAALERRPDAERRIDSLAYHAWEAHDPVAARRYGERAGDGAAERGMYADARASYERVLAALEGDDDRARVLEQLGGVHRAEGDCAAAIAAFDGALALRLARGEYDDATRLAVALAVERSNSGADALPALQHFIAENGPRLGDAGRDAVNVFLARMWTAHGRYADSERLLADLAQPAELAPRVRANLLTARLNLSEYRGDVAAWRRHATDMLALAPELPPLLRAIQLTSVAQTGAWFAEREIAATALADAQAIATHWGFESLLAFTHAVEAQLTFLAGDLDAARRALAVVARRPDVAPAMTLASRLGPFLGVAVGDAALTRRWLRAAAAGPGEDAIYAAAATLAAAAHDGLIARDDVRAAREQLAAQLDELEPGTFVPPTVAVAAAQSLDAAQLARLRAAALAYRASADHPVARATSDLVIAIVATRSGDADRDRAAAAAQQFHDIGWPLFEALALEHAGVGMKRPGTGDRVKRENAAGAPSRLTAREWQVATLVAEGNSNVAIGEQLDVGIKTVEKHVSSVLLKLGARSRAQIATFVATNDRSR
jgi:DNA-binding NarL/FixJ family response regulator